MSSSSAAENAPSTPPLLLSELVNDKGKQKKWRKKVEKGEINTSLHFAVTSLVYGLKTTPKVICEPDKTRSNSEHDLQLHELRDFLQAVLINEMSMPKYFKMENRAYVRRVVHMHVAHADASLSVSSLLGPQALTLRLARAHSHSAEEAAPLPRKLLTLSAEECLPEELLFVRAEDVQREHALAAEIEREREKTREKTRETEPERGKESMHAHLRPYVMNPSMLKLWNYPLSCELFRDELQRQREKNGVDIDTPNKTEEEPAAKRARRDPDNEDTCVNNSSESDTVVGVLVGAVPSARDLARARAQSLLPAPVSVCLYDDFPHNNTLRTDDDFWPTLSVQSEAFRALSRFISSRHNGAHDDRKTHGLRVLALDCEMVLTAQGAEVARVTLVDEDEDRTVLLDTLVCPSQPVLDYKTAFSGITAEMLTPVTVTLDMVRLALLLLVPQETIVVGHSLENDWRALRMLHPRNVDTAQLFPHPRGFPLRHKLKHLAKQVLGLDIQQSNNNNNRRNKSSAECATQQGHDSVEDAVTALQLVVRKLEGGPSFGLGGADQAKVPLVQRLCLRNARCWLGWSREDTQKDKEKEFRLSAAAHGSAMESAVGGDAHVCREEDENTLWQEMLSFLRASPSSLISGDKKWPEDCHSAEDLVQRALPPVKFCALTLTQHPSSVTAEMIESTLARLRQDLQSVTDAENAHTLVVVTTQPSLEPALRLQEKQRLCQKRASSLSTLVWTREDEMALQVELKKVQLCGVALHIF